MKHPTPAADRLSLRTVLALWVLGLVPRLIPLLFLLNAPIALEDMFQYDMLARSLASGRGYRWYAAEDVEVLKPYLAQYLDLSALRAPPEGLVTAHRAPGYPFFLAGLYLLIPSEHRFAAARLVQAVLAAFMSPLVAMVALQMKMGRRAAMMAAAGVALYPILLFYPVGLASENLFIPLVLLSFWLLLRAAGSGRLTPFTLAGLVLGFSTLTRSIFFPATVLASVWLYRLQQARNRGALLTLAVTLTICIPWAVRNTLTLKRLTFVESSLGYNLFIGYHPEGNGGFVADVAIKPLTILNDAERERFCTRTALQYIAADPVEAGRRVLRRVAYFMGVEDREFIWFYTNDFIGFIPQPWLGLIYSLLVVPWVSTVAFAVLGLSLSPERSSAGLAGALIAGYALPHFFIIAEPRFHLALVPLLMPFAAWGWLRRREVVRLARQYDRKTLLALLFIVICAALWIWGIAHRWDLLMAIFGPEGNRLYLSY